MSKPITIYPRAGANLSAMIDDLRTSRADGNPYLDRSVSEVARMLLADELRRQHKRFCPERPGSSLNDKEQGP